MPAQDFDSVYFEATWSRIAGATDWECSSVENNIPNNLVHSTFSEIEKVEVSHKLLFERCAHAGWTVYFSREEVLLPTGQRDFTDRWSVTLDALCKVGTELVWHEALISAASGCLVNLDCNQQFLSLNRQLSLISISFDLDVVDLVEVDRYPVVWRPQAMAILIHELVVHPAEAYQSPTKISFDAGSTFSLSVTDTPSADLFGRVISYDSNMPAEPARVFEAVRDFSNAQAQFSGAELFERTDSNGVYVENRTTNAVVELSPEIEYSQSDFIEVGRIMEGSVGESENDWAVLFVAEAWVSQNGERTARIKPFYMRTDLDWLLKNAQGASGSAENVNFICESAAQTLPVGCRTPGLVTRCLPEKTQTLSQQEYIAFLAQIL